MADTTVGTLIDGRYKVLSRLGAGGMADVYLAEDQQLGRKVALKLLHRRFAEDPGFVERFRREAQAAAGLQHPNVVSVYDRGVYDDTYYIAMEYLPGRTLKQLIRQEAPIDPIRAIEITVQILKAARFAHRRGVIHRDLKPHNVIVDEADHAKVTDFGIARAGASDMTETGSIMGTAQYLSPEQAQGHAVSAGSDLYSVGVILYELVTGRVPFDAEAAVTIAIKHVSEAPVPPRAINPRVPPELEQVILWAMNKNPGDRPTDADQFIQALEQVKAVIVSGASGERTASFAAIAAVQAYGNSPSSTIPPTSITDTGAPVTGPYAGDGTFPPGEYRADKRRRWWLWALAVAVVLLLAGAGVAAYLLLRPAKAVVPTVVLQQQDVAQANITNAGLTASVIYRTDLHKSGTVIAQTPLGGQKVDKGTTVTLTVSQGPGNTSVPSVTGLTRRQAIAELKQLNLTIAAIQSESSDTINAGLATRTDPQAGASLPPGTPVTLFISSGKPNINVPDVTSQQQGPAVATLKNAGFANVATTPQVTTAAPPGTVIRQNPQGGTSAPPTTTITLTIAQAPPKVNVPNVVGKKPGGANADLTGAGFTVSQQSQDVTDKTKGGVVISQTPAAGSSQIKGSNVTIVVGHYVAPTTTTTTTRTTTTTTHTTTTST